MPIQNVNQRNCCGCRACEQSCPSECISVYEDREGFLIAHVDQDRCVKCEMCKEVCPIITPRGSHKIKGVFAVQNRNDSLLMRSSSGGAFRLIADYVIDNNGIICSCTFDDSNSAVFEFASDKTSLNKMQGSKYVQSDTKNSFKIIKEYLDQNTTVLFVGAPCQCAGLLNFLHKDYDNLITVDFICHGMPSKWIFNEYLKYIESKTRRKPYDIQFRDKSARGWGPWFSYKQEKNNKTKKTIRNASVDPYLNAYYKGMMNRYICYDCPFQGRRSTDYTIADYWGVEKYHKDLDKIKGVSILSVNTDKAFLLFDSFRDKAIIRQSSIENASIENESLVRKETRNIPPIRNDIYTNVEQKGWGNVAKDVLKYKGYWKKKIWYSLPHGIVRHYKRMISKLYAIVL